MTSYFDSPALAQQFPLLALACGLIQVAANEELAILRIATRKQDRRLKRIFSQSPIATRYLGGPLHDSAVMDVRSGRNRVVLTVDEFSSHCLFDVLAKHVGLTRRSCYKRAAPLEIKFSDVNRIELIQISRNGSIRKGNLKAVRSSCEWIADEFSCVGTRGFCLGILFHDRAGKHLLLVIEAAKMNLVEKQRQAFIAAFGRQRLPIFDRYWKARLHRPFDCSNVSEFLEDAALPGK